MTYSDKLRDPRWQKKRLHVFEAAGWMCQLCGCTDKELHVHHPQYIRGREPWDYTNLISLCATCHEGVHGRTGSGEKPKAVGEDQASRSCRKPNVIPPEHDLLVTFLLCPELVRPVVSILKDEWNASDVREDVGGYGRALGLVINAEDPMEGLDEIRNKYKGTLTVPVLALAPLELRRIAIECIKRIRADIYSPRLRRIETKLSKHTGGDFDPFPILKERDSIHRILRAPVKLEVEESNA